MYILVVRILRTTRGRRTIKMMERHPGQTEERKKEEGRAAGQCRDVLRKREVHARMQGKYGKAEPVHRIEKSI